MCGSSAFPSCILHHYRVFLSQAQKSRGVRSDNGVGRREAGSRRNPGPTHRGKQDHSRDSARLTSDSIPEPLRAQAPMGRPGQLQHLSFTCSCSPLLENSFLKLGITQFQGPAVKISGRPASTFHSQPCLKQTWVPLTQFLQ